MSIANDSDSYPFLAIARRHRVPYSDVLLMADVLQRRLESGEDAPPSSFVRTESEGAAVLTNWDRGAVLRDVSAAALAEHCRRARVRAAAAVGG